MAFVVTWVVADPGVDLFGDDSGSPLDYVFTVLNYVGVATPNFMLALVLMWMAFAYFGMSITGLFSPETRRRRGASVAWATSSPTSGCRRL